MSAPSRVLEEVVVTARRFEESISDAPLAVNVMSGDYLRDQQITNIQDIIELTPGATWGEFTKAQPAFTLRGINAGSFGNSSLETGVQLVIDGIAQTKAFMMTPPVYDLQRVEIMNAFVGAERMSSKENFQFRHKSSSVRYGLSKGGTCCVFATAQFRVSQTSA